jgi:hypothetical protein
MRCRNAKQRSKRMSDIADDIDSFSSLSTTELAQKIKALTALKRVKSEEERAAKPPSKRGRGILETTKKILLEQPDIHNDDLFNLITERCGSCSRTVMETVRSDFKHSLRVLKEAGRLKEPDEMAVIVVEDPVELEPEPEPEPEVQEEETMPEPPRRRRGVAAAE